MIRFRFVLLGLMFAAPLARAADLPTAKAAPVEYVRVCSVHGAGFFYIPGSDTCIKLGGRVRADYGYYQPSHSWSPKASYYGSDAAKTPKRPYEVYDASYVYGRNVDAAASRIDARVSADLPRRVGAKRRGRPPSADRLADDREIPPTKIASRRGS